MTTQQWLPAWTAAAVAFGGASLIVPLYVVELGGTAFHLGILFASSSFVGVPSAFLFGRIADRTGKRRQLILITLVIATVTIFLIPLLETILAVIVVNAILWFGFAAAVPVLTLLVVSEHPTEQWGSAIASLNTFQGVGWAAGLGLGFLLITVLAQLVDPVTAQRAFFGACGILVAGGFLFAFVRLPPDSNRASGPKRTRMRRSGRIANGFNISLASFPFTPTRFDPRQLRVDRFRSLAQTQLSWFFAGVIAVFAGFGVFFGPLPALFADVGLSDGSIFGLYFLLNAAAALAFGYAGRRANQGGLVTLHLTGLLLRFMAFLAVGAVLMILGGSLSGLVLYSGLFVLIGASWAIIAMTATMIVTRVSPIQWRGEALGAYGAIVALGGGIGGLFGGSLATFGTAVVVVAAGGLIGLGILIMASFGRRNRSDPFLV